ARALKHGVFAESDACSIPSLRESVCNMRWPSRFVKRGLPSKDCRILPRKISVDHFQQTAGSRKARRALGVYFDSEIAFHWGEHAMHKLEILNLKFSHGAFTHDFQLRFAGTW